MISTTFSDLKLNYSRNLSRSLVSNVRRAVIIILFPSLLQKNADRWRNPRLVQVFTLLHQTLVRRHRFVYFTGPFRNFKSKLVGPLLGTSLAQIPHMAPHHRHFLLPFKSPHRVPFPHQPVLFVQLFIEARNGDFCRSTR